jgi:hypothetical protein
MTTNDEVRYYLEHEAMPRTLYTAGPQIISALLLKGNKAVAQYYKKAEMFHQGYSCPYTETDFDVMHREYIADDHSFLVIRVGLPQPATAPLCRAVYFCTSNEQNGDFYITSELDATGAYFLCCWTSEHAHMILGVASEDEYDQVAECYKQMIINGDLEQIMDVCRNAGKASHRKA